MQISGTVRGTHFSYGNPKGHQTLPERNGAKLCYERIIYLLIEEEGNGVGRKEALVRITESRGSLALEQNLALHSCLTPAKARLV